MKDNDDYSYDGIGICGILTIIFVILKLTKTISWSWWWVFSPLWIPYAFIFVIGLIAVLSELIMHHFSINIVIRDEWDSEITEGDDELDL